MKYINNYLEFKPSLKIYNYRSAIIMYMFYYIWWDHSKIITKEFNKEIGIFPNEIRGFPNEIL